MNTLRSDAVYNLGPFDEKNQNPATAKLSNAISRMQMADAKWWEVSAAFEPLLIVRRLFTKSSTAPSQVSLITTSKMTAYTDSLFWDS